MNEENKKKANQICETLKKYSNGRGRFQYFEGKGIYQAHQTRWGTTWRPVLETGGIDADTEYESLYAFALGLFFGRYYKTELI